MIKKLFHLGNVTATAQVVSSLDEQTILAIVRRHAMGDWGDLCREDRNLKNKMSYKMDKKVDTKSLEDLTKEQLINIINNCSDATKTEILKYV